jgi:hypothetical protein
MSFLTIAQDVLIAVDFPSPSTAFANNDPAVKKVRRSIESSSYALARVNAWKTMRGERTFTSLAAEVQTGILPAGFDRFIPETFWNRTDKNLVIGPITEVEWASLKAYGYADTSRPKFIQRGNTAASSILMIPAPSAGKTFAFSYVNSYFCQSSSGTAQSAWAADTDVARLNPELVTLGAISDFLWMEGMNHEKADSDFEDLFNLLVKNDNPRARAMSCGDIFGSRRHFTGSPASTGNYNMTS